MKELGGALGEPGNREPRLGFHRAGFINSGDVLLSHNLEMHYHWGCSVSLPCSEWERVGPLRYDHQKAGEAEASPWGNHQGRSLLNFTRNSGDLLCPKLETNDWR
jgi:hypothetical protein